VVLVTTARKQLSEPQDMNALGLELLPDEVLSHIPAQFLHQKPHTKVLRDREIVETHTLPSIEGPQRAARTLKPLAVERTTISLADC